MPTCPVCSSDNIHTRNYGKRSCGAVGTVAGIATGLSSAGGGARVGAAVGTFLGPPGTFLGALLGAIVGGVAGATAGVSLGEVIDDHILINHECLDCGYTFSDRDEDIYFDFD
jgi:hypothetical protein